MIHQAVLLLSTLLVASLPFSSGITLTTFNIISVPAMGPHRITEVRARTTSDCASSCLNSFPACQSFLYNTDTRRCILGSKLNETEAPPSQDEGSLYVYTYRSDQCNMEDGYVLTWMDGGIPRCLYATTQSQSYRDSSTICESTGGYLASARSQDKLFILKTFLEGKNINSTAWLGLDNERYSRDFVWKDTGDVWNVTAMLPLFDQLPLDNDQGSNCISVNVTSGLLNSQPCDETTLPFVCEIDT